MVHGIAIDKAPMRRMFHVDNQSSTYNQWFRDRTSGDNEGVDRLYRGKKDRKTGNGKVET